jgi:hypothetical protein
MLLLPVAVAVFGSILHSYSWHLAEIREFKYDYEIRKSTWRNETGTMESFDYEEWRANQAD